MNKEKITALLQLKFMEKIGAKVTETAEIQTLIEEISELFTKQNHAYVEETQQLQQAVLELSKKQQFLTVALSKLVDRVNEQDMKMHSMDEVIDEMAEMLELCGEDEEECDCIFCTLESQITAENPGISEIFTKLPIEIIRVTK